jgi:hypothetical protein
MMHPSSPRRAFLAGALAAPLATTPTVALEPIKEAADKLASAMAGPTRRRMDGPRRQ